MSKTDQALILNIQEQLKRVMVQLSDLEKEKLVLDNLNLTAIFLWGVEGGRISIVA